MTTQARKAKSWRSFPIAAVVWLLVAIFVFILNGVAFAPKDERLQLDDLTIEGEPDAEADTLTLTISGTVPAEFAAQLKGLPLTANEEVYTSPEQGRVGSPLAQTIFAMVDGVSALTIRPDEIEVTRDGERRWDRMLDDIKMAVSVSIPRATLAPNLWLFTIGFASDSIISITPLDTGVLLAVFAVLVAMIEFGAAYYFRDRAEKLVRPLIRVTTTFILFWSFFGHEPFWDYVLSRTFPNNAQLLHPNATVITFAAQHLELVIVSSLITIPLGLAVGILVTRENYREFLPLVNNIANTGQTVPTLAIVAIMAPIIGFGFWPAIIALVLYGLLPVIRNTVAGLDSVSRFIIESAQGMGMTPPQILLRIELPIASSIIMAGVRTSMVINVGTAALGAFVGSGGLGVPIASGLSMVIDPFVLLGALPAALLAILIDYVLGRIEFVVTPTGLQIES
jgi:osmoprotectant transport system permease protein